MRGWPVSRRFAAAMAVASALALALPGGGLAQGEKSPETKKRAAKSISIDENGIRIDAEAGASGDSARARGDADFDEGDDPRHVLTTRGSDVVRVGQNIRIDADEDVAGDVVAVGGSIEVLGRVSGDVVSVGGSIKLHEGAVVNGEAVAVGGVVEQEEGSEIRGEVVSLGMGIPFFPHSNFSYLRVKPSFVQRTITLAIGLAVLIGLNLLFVLLFGTQVGRIAGAIRRDGLKSGLVGLLAMAATPPAMFLLTVTVIGIPAAALLAILLFLGFMFGLVGASVATGSRLVGDRTAEPSRFLAASLGLLALVAVFVGGRVVMWAGAPGLLAWFVVIFGVLLLASAAIMGLGAVVLTRFGSRIAGAGQRQTEAPASAPPGSAP